MLGAVSARVASPEFIGRVRELEVLGGLVHDAAAGRPGLALIGGESGVGKSRLMAEFAARAETEGVRVLAGDCVDLGGAELPYAPLVAALRGLNVEELLRMSGRGVRELATLLPQLEAEEPAPPAASLSQGRLFELMLALLRALGNEQPLVLIVEDAHWADPSTRDFLSFLSRNRRGERLAVAVTYRSDELHRRHPLRAFLAEADRSRTITRLTLERFTREELAAQLGGIFGRTPAPQVVEELFHRAEGNPFFTEELVAAGGDTADARLPDDVRDALMLRIEALSPDAQSVLRLAAAAGARVRHALLAEAASIDPDQLVGGLREAVAHHVLLQERAEDVYRFRHALLREAILDDLLPGERGPLHAALGRALSADPALSASGRGVAAELAAHWSAAHDLPAAFAASARAGAEAEGMAAYAEANAHFERAAELWDAVPPELREAGPSRVELLRRAAEAAQLAGDFDRAVALGRSALALVDAELEPLTAAGLHERLGRYLWISGLSRDALTELEIAVSLMPADAPAAERARVLGAQAQLLTLLGRAAEGRPRCEAALTLAREAGARLEECRILNTLGPALMVTGGFEEALGIARAARALAEELGDADELTRSYINLAEILDRSGRLAEAVEVSREGVAMARREGNAGVLPFLISELAVRLIRHGGWAEAEAILPEATAVPTSWHVGRSAALNAQGHLQALRGDIEGAERSLREATRGLRQALGSMWTAPTVLARADAALWDGRPGDARDLVEAELGQRQPSDDAEASYLLPLLSAGARAEAELAVRARATADADAERDAVRRARGLCDLGRELTAEHLEPEAGLHLDTALAEAERAVGRASARDWEELAGRWEEHGNRFSAAYCRWRQSELTLAAGGSRGDVPAVLASAHAAALELGAEPLRRELEDLARRARIPLDQGDGEPTPAAAGEPTAAERVGLTARELDVLRLMAGGSTNREIAEQLYISQKTVTVHVTRILAKLDARTRVEAAGTAQRLRLLDAEPVDG
jgi:DNA-binding CsgD family transcriptional regulator/tetratricopeptide (TPR) repeat protein